MKKLLLLFTFSASIAVASFGQADESPTLYIQPTTPLEYYVFELAYPMIKPDYTTLINYAFPPINYEVSRLNQHKYSDIPLYDIFNESIDFIETLDAKSTVTRTSNYIAYKVEARNTTSDPFVVYARDTFFLSGVKLTSISETLYDTKDYTVDSYAAYDVVYHSNGKVEEVKLKKYNAFFLSFGGIKIVYNINKTIQSDTIYRVQFDMEAAVKVSPNSYEDFYYNEVTPLKADSCYHYDEAYDQKQSTRYYYISNAYNQVTSAKVYSYDSEKKTYEYTVFKEFSNNILLSVLNSATALDLSIYPNPATDVLNIKDASNISYWTINDVAGNIIKQGTSILNKSITVSDLEAGCYILTMSDGDKTWVGRFIK